MDVTLILAKVIGTYLVLAGLGLAVHQKFFLLEFATFREKESRLLLAVFDTVIGLFIIYTSTSYMSVGAVVVTVVGWITFVRGAISMLVTDSLYAALAKRFGNPSLLFLKAFLSVLVGLYLIAFGFGLV